MTRNICQGVLLLLLGVALAACSDSSPSLTVRVATSLVPGPEFAHVEVDIIDNATATSGVSAIRHSDATASFGEAYADGKQVASFEGVGAGELTVRVRLLQPDGSRLLERRVRVTISSDTPNYVLVVHMSRECVSVECPNPAGDSALTECLAGQCVDPRCNPPAAEFCPASIFCNSVADCGPVASCAQMACVDGICESSTRENACDAAEWCDPDVTAGCTPFVAVDAGVPDAGMMDMGSDAMEDAGVMDAGIPDAFMPDSPTVDSGPVCGTICASETDPCRFDYWDCSSGTPTCAGRMQRPTGTSCGVGLVCDIYGYCNPCVPGAECLAGGCSPGQMDCTDGYENCVATGEPALPEGTACADGWECSADARCLPLPGAIPCDENCLHGYIDLSGGVAVCVPDGTFAPPGGYCGAGRSCNSTGSCVACVGFQPCNYGCNVGVISCSDGPVCIPTGSDDHLPAGTVCGAGRVCDGLGTCGDCTAGEVCAPELECQYRLIDCSRGRQCMLASNRPFGTPCAGGVCDGDGACALPLNASYVTNDGTHACALMVDGTVQCWGQNMAGELGNGSGDFPLTTKYTVAGLTNVAEIATADQRSCARTSSGAVYCWGRNYSGEIGDGTTNPSAVPVAVTLPNPAISISASQSNTCAVLNTGSVMCWGNNAVGLLGNGTTMDSLTPTLVTGLSDASKVYVVGTKACALRTNGHVSCWGQGGMGNGASASLVPVEVTGLDQVMDLSLANENNEA